jgi:hypothetical protein
MSRGEASSAMHLLDGLHAAHSSAKYPRMAPMSTGVPPNRAISTTRQGQHRFIHPRECDAVGNNIPLNQFHVHKGTVFQRCRFVQWQPILLLAAIQACPNRYAKPIRNNSKQQLAIRYTCDAQRLIPLNHCVALFAKRGAERRCSIVSHSGSAGRSAILPTHLDPSQDSALFG